MFLTIKVSKAHLTQYSIFSLIGRWNIKLSTLHDPPSFSLSSKLPQSFRQKFRSVSPTCLSHSLPLKLNGFIHYRRHIRHVCGGQKCSEFATQHFIRHSHYITQLTIERVFSCHYKALCTTKWLLVVRLAGSLSVWFDIRACMSRTDTLMMISTLALRTQLKLLVL